MPNCSVPYCVNTSNKNSDLTFHEFPHHTPLFLNAWLERIGRPNWRPGSRSVVCSDHFDKEDFCKGQLRLGAYPSKFPECPFKKKKKKDESTQNSSPTVASTALAKIIPSGTGKELKTRELVLSSYGGVDMKPNLDVQESCKNISSEHDKEQPQQQANRGKVEPDGAAGQRVPHTFGIEYSDHTYMKRDPSAEREPKKADTRAIESPEKLSSENKAAKVGSSDSVSSESRVIVKKILKLADKDKVGIPSEKVVKVKISSEGRPGMSKSSKTGGDNKVNITAQNLVSVKKTGKVGQSSIINSPEAQPRVKTENIAEQVENIQTQYISTAPKGNISSSFSLLACRICQKTSNLNTAIFSKEGQAAGLSDLINKHLPIQVSEDDSLPLRLCDGCASLLKAYNTLINVCEKTEKLFRGSLSKSNGTDKVSKPNTTQKKHLKEDMCRVLLLEMAYQHQMPVKKMIAQAKDELSLRLHPKESRLRKPYGRIMFTDLQGGVGTYPDQLSRAVSIMFSCTPSDDTNPRTVQSITKQVPPKPVVQVAAPPAKLVTQTPTLPSPALVPAGLISFLQGSTLPPGVKIAIPPTPSACLTAIPSLSTTSVVSLGTAPPLLSLPPPLAPVMPTSTTCASAQLSTLSQFDSNSLSSDGCGGNESPDLIEVPSNDHLTLRDSSQGKSPPIDVSKMKERIVTKINNKGKQFKLGDKIVGIVVRDSQTSEEIQQKLLATFSKPNKDVPAAKVQNVQKIQAAEALGNEGNPPPLPIETPKPRTGNDAIKKIPQRFMEIYPEWENFSSHFDRRNAQKPTLSFVWKKTGFLVSSYQKLFTWQLPDDIESEPILTCRVCKYRAKSQVYAENHLTKHPDLQCLTCRKYFLTAEKVQEHVQIIHNLESNSVPKKMLNVAWRQNTLRRCLKVFQCSCCEKRFKQKETLQRHSLVCKDKSLTEKVVSITNANVRSCPICNKSAPTTEAMQEHMLVHTKRTSWLCDVCGMVFNSPSSYRTHISRHEEHAHEFQFQCEVCKKRFKILQRYEEHKKKHEVQHTYVCPHCGKVFRTLNGLRQHEILHGERKLQCRFCPSRFHRRDHLRTHEATHTKTASDRKGGQRKYRCRFCPPSTAENLNFVNMRQLLDHYEEAHSFSRGKIPGSKTYKCDRCPRAFINSTLLRHHIMWHAGQRPYHCGVCGAGFMLKERLRNHENIHSNARPHVCNICGKGFRGLSVLKQHKKVHLDPSQQLKCRYCDKMFNRKDNRRTHEATHTGIKPWKCLICERTFRMRADCSKHVAVVHKVISEAVRDNMEKLNLPSTSSVSVEVDDAIQSVTSVQSIQFLLEEADYDEEMEEESI